MGRKFLATLPFAAFGCQGAAWRGDASCITPGGMLRWDSLIARPRAVQAWRGAVRWRSGGRRV